MIKKYIQLLINCEQVFMFFSTRLPEDFLYLHFRTSQVFIRTDNTTAYASLSRNIIQLPYSISTCKFLFVQRDENAMRSLETASANQFVVLLYSIKDRYMTKLNWRWELFILLRLIETEWIFNQMYVCVLMMQWSILLF